MNKKIFIISIIIFSLLQLNSFGKYKYSKKINAYQLEFKPNDYIYTNKLEENIDEKNNGNNYILKKQNTNNESEKTPIIVQIIK